MALYCLNGSEGLALADRRERVEELQAALLELAELIGELMEKEASNDG